MTVLATTETDHNSGGDHAITGVTTISTDLEDLVTQLCDALARGADTRQVVSAIGNIIATLRGQGVDADE